MRRAAIAAFILGIAVYPLSFMMTVRSYGGEFTGNAESTRNWIVSRTLAVTSVALFAFSVAAAFLVPDRARRIWWVVPATVLAIAVVYFDLIGFGFTP